MTMKIILAGKEKTVTAQELFALAAQGAIGPKTPVYINGKTFPAGKAKGIEFNRPQKTGSAQQGHQASSTGGNVSSRLQKKGDPQDNIYNLQPSDDMISVDPAPRRRINYLAEPSPVANSDDLSQHSREGGGTGRKSCKAVAHFDDSRIFRIFFFRNISLVVLEFHR